MSETKILVPVKIEALVVDSNTSGGKNWKDFSLNYTRIWDRLGVNLEPGDLKEFSADLCEPGIHIHWALPSALTNGIYNGKQMVFPAVPNRWMVIRTQLLTDGQQNTKKWIIESDYVSADVKSPGKSPWVTQNPDGSYSDTCIGRAVPFETGYKESSSALSPLTAMAPGNPAFAAIYQSCRNVFGLYDDLKNDDLTNIDEGTFSYLITGWYSNPSIDPLNIPDDAAPSGSPPIEIKKNIQRKWQVNSLGEKDSFPSETFCHGFIHSVNWNKNKSFTLPCKDTQVNVTVGYTSIEAKSVQLSKQTGAAEKLLSAYFYDALKDLSGTAEIETQVDNRAFSHYDGGTLWEIQRSEKDINTNNDKEKQPAQFPDALKYPGLSDSYKCLNTEQQKLDRLCEEKKSMLVEFRALCDKMIKDSNQIHLNTNPDKLKKDIDDISGNIKTTDGKIQDYIRELMAFKIFSEKDPDGKPIKREFELVNKKMPRYWKPNDPTVVFSGPGVNPSFKYKNTDSSGKLECRLIADIISGIKLFDGGKDEETIVPSKNYSLALDKINLPTTANIEIINKLFCEAILLDPSYASEWAFIYYNDPSRNNQNAKTLGVDVKNVLNLTKDATNTNKFKGLTNTNGFVFYETILNKTGLSNFLEERAIQKWSHPWTPIYMIWYANWIPAYQKGIKQWNYLQGNWAWENKKYNYQGSIPIDERAHIEFSGKAILTDAVTAALNSRLPQGVVLGHSISQAFTSLSDSLLMRLHSVQLPLLKKAGTDIDPVLLKDTTYDAYTTNDTYFFPDVPHADAQSNNANNFFPIRAGHIRITRLWITDAFGQVQKVIDPDNKPNPIKGSMHIAENLATKSDPNLITLTPRIIQPSRLSFRWMNANSKAFEESTSDPATNPVCGWVMPDYLDNSLNIYEASGKGCGSVRIIEGNVKWNGIPGSINSSASTPDNSIANSYLRSFVTGLLNLNSNGGFALNKLCNLCKNMAMFLNTSASHQAPGIAGLMGQPVALVRAALKFELLGLPAQPQGWTDMMTADSIINPPGLSGFEFPVSLGDTRNSKDGLIGYFTGTDFSKFTGTDFSKMVTAFGTPVQENAYFENKDINLIFQTDQLPTEVILLMDPHGGVQADCGLLPSKFIDLPHQFTDQALKNIELNLLVSPFLGSVDDPDIPVSPEPGKDWFLLRKTAPAGWKEVPVGNQKPLKIDAFNSQKIQEGYLKQRTVVPGKS